MRLWAEERKTGTVELLLTLPMPTWQIVIGKYMAAWIFVAIALSLTFPLWITANWLGSDNGVIVASYIACTAAVTCHRVLHLGLAKNQVIAFILAAVVCFIFLMSRR